MGVVIPTNNTITQRNCFNVLGFVAESYLMHCSLPLERKAADLENGPPPEGFGSQGGGLRYPPGVKAAMSIINPIRQILVFESMAI
jgi:hypothetical protein